MDADDPALELAARLRRAIARSYSRFRSERSDGEVAEAGLLAMHQLDRAGPMGLAALSDAVRVTPGSMSQTVNRLQAEGYLERRSDPQDKRRVLLALTASGAALVARAHRHRQDWLNDRLAALSQAERRTLGKAAAILLRMVDA